MLSVVVFHNRWVASPEGFCAFGCSTIESRIETRDMTIDVKAKSCLHGWSQDLKYEVHRGWAAASDKTCQACWMQTWEETDDTQQAPAYQWGNNYRTTTKTKSPTNERAGTAVLWWFATDRRSLSGARQTCQGLSKWIVGAGKHEYTEIEGHTDWGVSGPTVDSLQLIPAKRNLVLSPLCPSQGLKGILKMELPHTIVTFCNFCVLGVSQSQSWS